MTGPSATAGGASLAYPRKRASSVEYTRPHAHFTDDVMSEASCGIGQVRLIDPYTANRRGAPHPGHAYIR